MSARKASKQQKITDGRQPFEASLKRLEAIVESLEEGEVPLEKAVELYEEGITLSKRCSETLRATELRIKKLGKNVLGEFELTDAESED
jgi:exodeoxyribonuclease VII small subunit